MTRKQRKSGTRNPVAKYAARFQRAVKFRDRTKYRHHNKHKGRESFPLVIVSSLQWKGFQAISNEATYL